MTTAADLKTYPGTFPGFDFCIYEVVGNERQIYCVKDGNADSPVYKGAEPVNGPLGRALDTHLSRAIGVTFGHEPPVPGGIGTTSGPLTDADFGGTGLPMARGGPGLGFGFGKVTFDPAMVKLAAFAFLIAMLAIGAFAVAASPPGRVIRKARAIRKAAA